MLNQELVNAFGTNAKLLSVYYIGMQNQLAILPFDVRKRGVIPSLVLNSLSLTQGGGVSRADGAKSICRECHSWPCVYH